MQNTRLFNRIINYLKGKDLLLPSVTTEDEGKVLTVEEKNVQGAVLVPEETFVFTDGIMTEINMQNKSLFVEGAECLLTVNGTTTTETVQAVSEPVSGLIVDDNEIGITILLEDSTNVAKLYVPNVGTYTVSLYVEGTEYVWQVAEPSGGSGYLGSFIEAPAVLQSTFNEIKNMVISGVIPWFIVNYETEAEPDMSVFTLQWLAYANDAYSCKFGCYVMENNLLYVNVNPDEDLTLD